jgi:putative peptide zinc metalloprotease protein
MPTLDAHAYNVVPFTVQPDKNGFVVGNSDHGEFYQMPEQGVAILNRLSAGETVMSIKSDVAMDDPDAVDVDDFVDQLAELGFIYPRGGEPRSQAGVVEATADQRRVFAVDSRIAGAFFSGPVRLAYVAVVTYALVAVLLHPELRINFGAFYTETNRTALLLLLIGLTFIEVCCHECGHMLAAARYGIKPRYGFGNRLWIIVAESDLSGIMALPKSQRYLPMLAGVLVDVLFIAFATILLHILLSCGSGGFTIQVCQAFILELFAGIVWQFDIFVKTDVYFVLCNYFSHPDLDNEARIYIKDLLYRFTFGRFGQSSDITFRDPGVLRMFSAVWFGGRLLAFSMLFLVFLPTLGKYIVSAVLMLGAGAPPASRWAAIDTIMYAVTMLTTLGIGMYMWLRKKQTGSKERGG